MSKKLYFECPDLATVTMGAPDVFDAHKFANTFLTTCDYGKGGEALRLTAQVMSLFKDSKPGDLVEVDADDAKIYVKAVDEIEWKGVLSTGQTVDTKALMIPLLTFCDAWKSTLDHDEAWYKRRNLKSVDT